MRLSSLVAAVLLALSALASPAAAQSAYLKDVITGAPLATTPFGPDDVVPVIQNDTTKHYPVLSITPGMLPDASNASLPTAPNNILGNTTANLYFAQAYGSCTWNSSGSDVSTCINAAIVAANAAGGGTVMLPSGTDHTISETILLKNKVTLAGAGAGPSAVCGTRLVWNGAVGGTMIQIGDSTLTAPITHRNLRNLCLQGSQLAATGVEQWSLQGSFFDNIVIRGVTTNGWRIRTSTNIGSNLASNQNLNYSNIIIYNCDAGATAANGFLVDKGTAQADLNRSIFTNLAINVKTGNGFDWGGSDANWVFGGFIQTCGVGSTGYGMIFRGKPDADGQKSRGNMLFGTIVGGAGLVGIHSEAGAAGLDSATDNVFYGRKTEDAEPTPTCAAQGSASDAPTFYWSNVAGNLNSCGGTGWGLERPKITWRMTPKTANYTVATTDRGTTFTNEGAASAITFTLPPASGGGNPHCFSRVTAQQINIAAVGTDTIRLSRGAVSSAAGTISANSSAAEICLLDTGTGAGAWRTMYATGLWSTDLNTAALFGAAVDPVNNNTLLEPGSTVARVSTAAHSWTNDTTFATVDGLSIPLQAGKSYTCRGFLRVTASGAGGGIKVKIASDGTLTGTSSAWVAANYNGTTTNQRNSATGLVSTIGEATAVSTLVDLEGSIVVNVAGSLVIQAAQNVADAAATTIGANSHFACTRVN